MINSQLGKDHKYNPVNIRIVEKADVRTAFDEVKAVREENEALRAEVSDMKQNLIPLMSQMMERLQTLNANQKTPVNLESAILKEIDKVITEKKVK